MYVIYIEDSNRFALVSDVGTQKKNWTKLQKIQDSLLCEKDKYSIMYVCI